MTFQTNRVRFPNDVELKQSVLVIRNPFNLLWFNKTAKYAVKIVHCLLQPSFKMIDALIYDIFV